MNIQPIDITKIKSLKSGASIFSSKEWASMYPYGIEAFEILNKNDERVGGFSLFKRKKAGMVYAITPPFSPHIALEYTMNAEKSASRISEAKKIYEAIAAFLLDEKIELMELAFPPSESDMQVFQWKEFDIKPRYTYHLDLSKDDAQLLDAMTPERRKNIKKAEADGLRVELTDDLEAFKSVLKQTLQKAGGGFDESILNKLLEVESLEGNRDLWLSYEGDDVRSCALVVRDATQAYYLIGGMAEGKTHQGAQALTLWKAMGYAREKGCSIFDLEGSMVPDIEKYFRGFGGEMKTYYQIEKKSILGKMAGFLKKQIG